MSDAPLMLSVSGMRGLIGKSLTPPVAARFAAAFGQWLRQRAGSRAPRVVLGRDSRPSGAMIESAAVAGLVSVGCRVTTLGIVTTPTVAVMAEHLGADGGMVITASHNPIIWNGLKALRHDGVAPPPDQAKQIIESFKADAIDYAPVEKLQPIDADTTANRVHVDRVLKSVNVALIRAAKLRVVLDSVHGAGGPAAAMMLRELGVDLVHLFAEPTGHFPHTPEPTRENLVGLCDAMKQHKADAGFAQDPDADRLAIVDERGVYIGEEYTLALTAMHALERAAAEKRAGKITLAANLSTSRMIDDLAARHGATVLRTPVGEANVAAAMREHKSLLGGEGNGGVIWPPVVHVRDSLSGMALVLEMLAAKKQPLSKLIASTPSYAIVKDKFDLKPGMAERIAPTLKQKFAGQKIDDRDGVRIDWPAPNARWVHARTSNTEPIMRIIAEASDEAAARGLVNEVRAALGL